MSKFIQDFKINVHYKMWWITVITTLIIIVQCFGFDLTKLVGQDWKNILDIIFALLTALGVHTNLTDTPPADEVTVDVAQSTQTDTTVQQ